MKKLITILTVIALMLVMVVPAYAVSSVPYDVLKAKNSVVRVVAEYSDGYSTGSGFIINKSGNKTLIATNHHVVEGGAKNISVLLNNETYDADIVAKTSEQDLCILSVDGYLKSGVLSLDSNAKQGESVYAIGFPEAAEALSDTLASATITDGIISAIREVTIVHGGEPVELLQINADINSGNSGGPLLSSNGKVLGINTYGVEDSSGINGAIAVSELIDFAMENGIRLSRFSIWPVVITVFAIVAVLLLVSLITRKVNGHKHNVKGSTLSGYINSLSKPLTAEQSVTLLMPIAVSLRKLHDDGKPHLQVSPTTVKLTKKGAVLTAPDGDESKHYSSGFAAPEIYRGMSAGTVSDIYSFTALLLYCMTGVAPPNSLDRLQNRTTLSADNLYIDGNLAQLIKSGMSLSPDTRISSMAEMIQALSRYNTGTALPETRTPSTEKIKKPKVKKVKTTGQKIGTAFGLVALAAVLIVGAFFGSYFYAVKSAMDCDFVLADKLTPSKSLISTFDPQFEQYINAGLMLENEKFDEAELEFAKIEDYRDSADKRNECKYQKAETALKNDNFTTALDEFQKLSSVGYKDSLDKYQETLYLKNLSIFQSASFGRWANALRVLREYAEKNYLDATEQYDYYLREIYEQAVDLYHSGINPSDLFDAIGDYENAKLYYDLSSYRNCSSVNLIKEQRLKDVVEKFKSNVNFEDIKEVLVSYDSIARRFLYGTWKTADGLYYFSIDPETKMSQYNLPFYDLNNATFSIEDGIYKLTSDGLRKINVFKIAVIDADTISVYCYNGGQTYRMYRQ